MPKTRDELVDRALSLLSILAAGQSASAEDQEVVDAQVDPTLADLSGRRIVYIGDDEAIEDEYFNHVAECLAAAVSPDFGADFQAWELRRARAEDRLKVLTRRSGTGEMLKSNELTGININRGFWYDWSNS